jgi:hypothetical protein
MTNAIVAAAMLLTAAAGTSVPSHGDKAELRAPLYGPYIEVWTSAEVFEQGDRAHVWFRSEEDAFVTVFRVDTDGRVRVMYPQRPWHNNFVPAGYRLEVWSPSNEQDRYAFTVNDYPGTGYIFAVASRVPFDYRQFVDGEHWDYRNIGYQGRIAGDPYVALTAMVERMVPVTAYDEYSYDIYPYHVGHQYDYPRFLCYDCHTYVAYPSWDPYEQYCARFRIVVYDDPYYYPATVYPGTRVVYVRPRRVEARYVFRSRTNGDAYVTRVRSRPVNPTRRRAVSSGATSRDVGGVGAVPVPVRRSAAANETAPRRTYDPAMPSSDRRLSTRYRLLPMNPTTVRIQPKLERRQPEERENTERSVPVPVRRVGPVRGITTKPDPTRVTRPGEKDTTAKANPPARKAPPKKKVKPDSSSMTRRR